MDDGSINTAAEDTILLVVSIINPSDREEELIRLTTIDGDVGLLLLLPTLKVVEMVALFTVINGFRVKSSETAR